MPAKGDKLLHDLKTGFACKAVKFRRFAAFDQSALYNESGFVHGPAESPEALTRGHAIEVRIEHADPLMPQGDEVLCCLVRSFLIIHRQRIESLMICIDEDNGESWRGGLCYEFLRKLHREEEHSIDPAPVNVMSHRLLKLIRMVNAHEDEVDIDFAQLCLNALKDLHEKERREERNHRHDRIRPSPRQTAGVRMGSKIQTMRDAKDSFSRSLGNAGMVIEHS